MRSVLFTPGTRGDRIEKAIQRRAGDVVVADLEDAVGPEDKASARETVRDALQGMTKGAKDGAPSGPVRAVRVNTLESGLALLDLEVVMPARPGLVVVPKAQGVGDVVVLDEAIHRLERMHQIPGGSTGLLLIIESARGVLEAARLARASPRVRALAFGAEDLAADAGLRRSRENHEVMMARSQVALAAAAAGVVAVDQVFVDLEDEEGLQREALEARSLGYTGKMVIHPAQSVVVHRAFAPSAEELEKARRLVAAVDEGDVGEGGVLRFEGKMIDVPLIEQARRLLREHEAAQRADAT
jgi:citrate lyase beta subunit